MAPAIFRLLLDKRSGWHQKRDALIWAFLQVILNEFDCDQCFSITGRQVTNSVFGYGMVQAFLLVRVQGKGRHLL